MYRSICLIFILLAGNASVWATNISQLMLPAGFSITVYAEGLKAARQMAVATNGILYVGSMRAGKVYAVQDLNADGKADKISIVAKGLRSPSGIAWRNGHLYIGSIGDILILRDIDNHLDNPPKPQLVTDAFPDNRHHGWKYLGFGPDGRLYVPVGAPCNICFSEEPIFAALHRYDLVTGKTRLIASGIRNTVGFTWHPQTGNLWFTDNGRDLMGDDVPPDELNVITKTGAHFGYPFVHGDAILDPKYGVKNSKFVPPKLNMQAHSAALGLEFYTGKVFPKKYRGALFIAQHGSWNRAKKVGYQVIVVYMDGERIVGHEPFVSGWLKGEQNWGRPNDVLMLADGSLLISDDQAGRIYRVTYAKN